MISAIRPAVLGVALVFILNSANSGTCKKYDDQEIRKNINIYLSVMLGKAKPSRFDYYRYHGERDSSELDAELAECIRLFGHAFEGQDSQRQITKKCEVWLLARNEASTTVPSMYYVLLRKKIYIDGITWKIEQIKIAKEVHTTGHIQVALIYPNGRKVKLEVSHPYDECEIHFNYIKILSVEGMPARTYLELKKLRRELWGDRGEE